MIELAVKPTRRQALLSLVALWLHPAVPGLTGAAFGQGKKDLIPLLNAYVDILLPADDVSPKASELGVGQSIWALATDQPLLLELIARVGEWLDAAGAGRFVELSTEDQTAVVAYMEKANVDHLEGRFFQIIRLLAIEFYYAEPAAIAGLPLNPTPQPEGYPPPWA